MVRTGHCWCVPNFSSEPEVMVVVVVMVEYEAIYGRPIVLCRAH